MKELIRALSGAYTDPLVRRRRHLHAHPELSFQERETRAYVLSVLEELGIPTLTFPDSCAVVGRLRGDRPGRTIAFRADMDALPIREAPSAETAEFCSQNDGVMHACGHDGHTAVLLTLAQCLAQHRELVAGEVVFLFQNAEEVACGGGGPLAASGALEGVDFVFGMHLWPDFPLGTVAYAPREMMAAADAFEVAFTGAGGHGSQPHLTPDALLAGCAAVEQLQSIVSRAVPSYEPAVLSVCKFSAGQVFNIIPARAELAGTVRTFSEEVRTLMERRVREICTHTAAAHNVECRLDYRRGYPALINHPEVVERGVEAVGRLTDHALVETRPVMVAEDFSHYLHRVPGAFFFVGVGDPAGARPCALHSAAYRMEEGALNVALELFLALYEEFKGE